MDGLGTEAHPGEKKRRKNSNKFSKKSHEILSRESISSAVWDGESSKTGTISASSAGKKRRRQHAQDMIRSELPTWPFATEYGDHFETPMKAYRDVEMVLTMLAKRLGKKKKHLRIWDPYYCAGRTTRLLAQLGFPKVEHHKQDFYKVISSKKEPVHDVLVTNPPYSGDHKQRCLEYCRASGKPWLLLVPNYVATKDYYRLAVLGMAAAPGGEPFYIVPANKYAFDHPEGTGHEDSPFFALWYVHLGIHTQDVFQGAKAEVKGVSVLRSVDELGRTGAVRTVRRMNPRQRKALKKRNAAAAGMA